MSQFEVGDWVIITHGQRGAEELCVLGRVIGPSTIYRNAIRVDTIWRHDPKNYDGTNSGHWPYGQDFPWHVERCGPDGAV